MNKVKSGILVIILLLGIFVTIIPVKNQSNGISDSFEDNALNSISSVERHNEKNDYDPRGHLTSRFFYDKINGLNDTSSPNDGYYEQLLLDVEVNISQTASSGYGYVVVICILDWSLSSLDQDDGSFDEDVAIFGRSAIEDLSVGLHNITAVFNCTELRALKLPGPYYVCSAYLAEFTGSDLDEVDSIEEYDFKKFLFVIDEVFDIDTFDEPEDTNDIVFHNALLVNDILEVNFTIQTFNHTYSFDELYYIRLVLKNTTGSIIVHHEEVRDLEPNKTYEIVLEIPSEYLTAFKENGGFSSDTPTILFKEVVVLQIGGEYSPFDSYNMSYATQAYPTYNINVNQAADTVVLGSGETNDFGDMDANDSVSFFVFSDSSDDLLEMKINRTHPWNDWGNEFQVSVVDGWGRFHDISTYDPMSMTGFITWHQSWDNIETLKMYTTMGKFQGPWQFIVRYPDCCGSLPTQSLSVEVRIFTDSTPPNIDIHSPSSGDTFQQYNGIPVKGDVKDDTLVIFYELLHNNKVLFSFSPFESMGGGSGPMSNGFMFTWFPPHDLSGSINIVIKAYDLGNNLNQTTLSFTISPGTIQSPESTIAKGLEWLKSQQLATGAWEYYGDQQSSGMTALAALCFIQAGQAQDSVVTNAISFLRGSFNDDPDPSIQGKVITQSGHMTYETAMATITLIAYNATLPTYDGALDSLIDDAIEWLVATQNDETWGVNPSDPWYGGWRYGHDHQSSDLSVAQWVILALATYGYDDPALWAKVRTFVERCRGGWWDGSSNQWEADGGFTYTPSSQDWRGGGGGSYGSMTGAGIWGLFLSGVEPGNTNITAALDWIGSFSPEEIVGQNPHSGNQFEYYWYLCASKAFIMAGRDKDQWWYDEITKYLNTHMIAESSTKAYWDNSLGQEPPVFATVQAILSQQVFYGQVPIHTLEVSLETTDGSAIYLWNSAVSVGYNYTTGNEETFTGATYSGLLASPQIISIVSPSKGEYLLDIFPAAGEDGISTPQEMILRGRALTETGHVIRYRTKTINYHYPNDYPQVLRVKMFLTTIAGLDIHFLDANPPLFTHVVNLESVSYPPYVGLGQDFDLNVTLKNLGSGTIAAGTVFSEDNLVVTSALKDVTNWAENEQKVVNFHYSTSGLSAGTQTIVIGLIASDTNPLLVRVIVQVGNQAPKGTLGTIPTVMSGTNSISWNASDADGDSLTFKVIIVKPDGTKVTLASSLATMTYSFDSTAYPDGTNYKVIIEVTDGIDTIQLESSLFELKNGIGATTESPEISPGFELFFALLALSLILVYFRKKR